MTTQHVFLVEHRIDWEPSTLVGLYGSWEAMLYGVSVQYPTTRRHYKTFQTFTITGTDQEGAPDQWETPHSTRGYLQVTLTPVHTRTTDAFEVRLKTIRKGVHGDSVARASHNITDESHAEALASGWNHARSDSTSTYYVHKVTA